ncbi:MAG TPA: ribbon-helix-helix protein, CopG family [Arachnia sp.]|nr:ribbon-helix-helix protein, CopG family [Arachnia sp.]
MGDSIDADVVSARVTQVLPPRMTHAEALEAVRHMTDEDFPTAEDDELDGIIDEEGIEELIAVGHALATKMSLGRPSLTRPGVRSPQITLRMPEYMSAQLDDLAARTGKRRSDIVRAALADYLASA